MTIKTRVVRARMTEAQVERIDLLAQQRGMNSSELIRDLIDKAVEREEKLKIAASYSYLAGKIGEAVSTLVMDDSPQALSRASISLIWGMDLAKNFPTEEMRKFFGELQDLARASEADRSDPDASTLGASFIRARRMTPDEKARFKTLLLDLDSSIHFYTRW